MAIDLTIGTHAMSGVSKLLATSGGAHIYNVTLKTDADNGNLIGRSEDMKSFDNYEEAAVSEFKGLIQWQASNGNFYVEVTDETDALLVYNPPVSPFDAPAALKSEKAWVNKAGDVVRAHELKVGDVFELSAEGFVGTPEVGAAIDGVSSKKLVIDTNTP